MVTVIGTTNIPGLSEKPGGREAALSTTIAVFGTVGGTDGIGVSHEWNGIVCKSNMRIWDRSGYFGNSCHSERCEQSSILEYERT